MKRDAQVALLSALFPLLGAAELVTIASTPWASATFDGSRHELEILLFGDDAAVRAERLVTALPDAEFGMRDHFVAELVAVAHAATLTIEAVTIVAD